jgi:hypothetical protein
MRCWRWRFAQTLGRPSRWPPMTEDGIPLETLLEHAARARRLAIVLDGDPAALELSTTPKKWRPRSVGARNADLRSAWFSPLPAASYPSARRTRLPDGLQSSRECVG